MPYKSDIEKVTRTSESGDFPQVVLIDNCSACNLRCSMCDHKNIAKYRKIEIMDMGLYKKIIDEVALENPNVRIWEIFFGDPFLCKDMAKRIEYAKDKGLTDVVLNTNGVLMTPDWSRAIINAGLDAMYVGIDAATEETYDKIRLGGDFHKAVENVLAYRDILAKECSKGQKLFVQFVISDINEHELEDFKSFWMKEKVGVKIRPRISWAGLIEAENLRSNDGLKRKPCYWLMKTFNVCADGLVPFCTCDLHCRIKCGDLRSKTIREVWQGELKRYRQMHKEHRFNELPEMCQRCADWQSAYAEFY
jgi:pyruvate-formate lyase-activating enzyme